MRITPPEFSKQPSSPRPARGVVVRVAQLILFKELQLCYSIQPNVFLHNIHLVSRYGEWYLPHCQAAYRASTMGRIPKVPSELEDCMVLATHVPDKTSMYNTKQKSEAWTNSLLNKGLNRHGPLKGPRTQRTR